MISLKDRGYKLTWQQQASQPVDAHVHEQCQAHAHVQPRIYEQQQALTRAAVPALAFLHARHQSLEAQLGACVLLHPHHAEAW